MKIGMNRHRQYCQRQRSKHVSTLNWSNFWHASASRGFVSDSWAFLSDFSCTVLFGDICDQSRKLSKIAPNVRRFSPCQILLGSTLPKLVSTLSPWPPATSRGKVSWDYANYPKVIGTLLLIFKPNFNCSPLKFLGTPDPVCGVCLQGLVKLQHV